jgi:hypothetical protein
VVVEGYGVDFGCGLEVCGPRGSESKVGFIRGILVDVGFWGKGLLCGLHFGAALGEDIPM